MAENGFEDEAYRLFAKKGNNSFAFMWEHFDATTLWEVLQLTPIDDEELHFRSHSHPMQAGYDSWFYSGIGGIVPNEAYPGFQQFILKPMFTTFLNHASVSYESGYGKIVSNWKNNDATLSWEVSIPENSKAEIFIPNYGKDFNITENGKASKAIKSSTNFTSIGIYSSGTYNFEIKMQ